MSYTIIHDYKHTEYYESLNEAVCFQRWGWEFLRRNPEYQKDYQQYTDIESFDIPPGSKKEVLLKDQPLGGNHYTNPPAEVDESLENYLARCPDGQIIPFEHYMKKKYHICDIKNPLEEGSIGFVDINNDSIFGTDFGPWKIDALPDHKKIASTTDMGIISRYKDMFLWRMESYAQECEKDVLILAFDVKQSIDNQIKIARSMLDELKRKRSKLLVNARNKNKEYPKVGIPSNKTVQFSRYIRLLDADSAKAKPSEIHPCIYPNEKNTDTNSLSIKRKENLKKAMDWRDKYFLMHSAYEKNFSKNTPQKKG